jgi:hypothetical protein
MSLTLRSETFSAAANGGPNTRTTVGVGEAVVFTAGRPAQWAVNREARRGTTREFIEQFTRPGEYVVRAEAEGERAERTITVIAPTLRYEKVRDVLVPNGLVSAALERGLAVDLRLLGNEGVAMELRVSLTPLSVSFAGVQILELDCTAQAPYGACRANPPRHRAMREWATVGRDNATRGTDLASFCWDPTAIPRPIPLSGYNWRIPTVYRLGPDGPTVPFPDPTPQAAQFQPAAGAGTSSRGTFTIWKGGCVATARV